MMGLAKMAPDGWTYCAREIAAGVGDYFVGHGEETGRWIGRGAEALGLSGEVDGEGLSRLFGQGCHPVTGVALGRPFGPDDKAAVAGWALSFSPPKSVSILWALAPDEEVVSQVRAGHEAAVAAALESRSAVAAMAGLSRRRRPAMWRRCSCIAHHEPVIPKSTATSWSPTKSKPLPMGAGWRSMAGSCTRCRRRPGCSTRPPCEPS